MKSVKCAYCHNVFDAEFGVCPICGTAYTPKTAGERFFPEIAPVWMKLVSVVAVLVLLSTPVLFAMGVLELSELKFLPETKQVGQTAPPVQHSPVPPEQSPSQTAQAKATDALTQPTPGDQALAPTSTPSPKAPAATEPAAAVMPAAKPSPEMPEQPSSEPVGEGQLQASTEPVTDAQTQPSPEAVSETQPKPTPATEALTPAETTQSQT